MSLAIIELASIARGAVVLDAIVKRSPVTIRRAQQVSPGKYLIVIGGGVAEVDEGFAAALEAAKGVLVDQLFLPQAHDKIHRGLAGDYTGDDIDSLGLFETYTAAAAVRSLDASLKATEAGLCGLHLCAGIGGKGTWAVTGPLPLIEAAIEAASRAIDRERLVSAEVIARPHVEAVDAFLALYRPAS